MKENEVTRQTEQALLACLEGIPFLKVRKVKAAVRRNGWQPNLVIRCQNGKEEKTLVIETKASGQPKLAREAINQLLVYLKDSPESYAILAAPYISPQAAELCVQHGIGYLDLAGNCLFNFDKVFIKKEGNPNPFAEKRDLRSLYSPKAERALRALLNQAKLTWKVKELKVAAEISLGQAHNVKKLLSDREWIRTTTGGFWLTNPDALLKEWSENYNFRRNEARDFYSMKPLPEIESAIAAVCEEKHFPYALTGFSGAARMASIGRYQRAMAYIDSRGIEEVISRLGLKEVPSGANVTLLVPYDSGVFFGKSASDQPRVVSKVQLYLDLLGFRGRGEEAAYQILTEVIKPSW
ncbi:type IV toxin-antitoxin system AbiEi family antitoxin [Bdellovibrionota bacterium FG-1]